MTVIENFDTSRRFEGTVRETRRITPPKLEEEVRNIIVAVQQPGIDFSEYETVGVLKRGPEELGSPLYLRLYAVAGFEPAPEGDLPRIELCVRRCFYVDEVNGERYPGTVSNYLCDLQPGDTVSLTGPFGAAFSVPEDKDANLLMIGMGTGIAPFRTLVHRIYRDIGEWDGKVRLFHGAQTGLELLYRNDEYDDLGLYMNQDTFKAIEALSPRPHFGAPIDFERKLKDNADEVWEMVSSDNVYVYVAGLRQIGEQLDDAFADMAGSVDAWAARKEELREKGRWKDLLY